MKLHYVVRELSLTVRAGKARLDRPVVGGYAADLLGCAMAGSHPGQVWLTLQGHLNVVAIAGLNDLSGVIVTEYKPVSAETLAKADEEGIPILSTPRTTFEVAGLLWALGLRI